MTKVHNNAPPNPRELERPGIGVPGDDGIVDGEPGAGTDANYPAPPPKVKGTEHGDLTGATSTHTGAPGQMENTGGDGTAPNDVAS